MKNISRRIAEAVPDDLFKHYSGEFIVPELEEAFQKNAWLTYKKTSQISLLFGGIVLIFFGILDFLTQKDKWQLLELIAVRWISGIFLILSYMYIRKAKAYFDGFHILSFTNTIVAAAAIILLGIMLKLSFIQNILHGFLLTLVFYQFVHNRFKYIIFGCAFYPAVLLVFYLYTNQIDSVNLVRFILYFSSANALGVLILRSVNRIQRTNYMNHIKKESLNEELKNAIDKLIKTRQEVKVLQGLIPICARCKKIRDDKGSWNHLEAYIQRHSEAKFSHGICPECANQLYPEMQLFDK
ncbi:MAG: hypothetical protein V1874_16270 [Spirochaetota bacterium]